AEGKRKRYVNNSLISRCSLHIYIKDKEQIKFRKCHKELMRATPFAPYVDIPPMKCFGINLLEEIVAHQEVGNVFNIGNKLLSFTVEDVALILGMPCTGFPVHHYGSSIEVSKLHKNLARILPSLNRSSMETSTPALSINAQMVALVDALNAAEESRKTENEDF
ncbi:hypothetical protein Taro_024074, partial [Colocasia esculenta]|nr:hypothetical protein [Colocasia esculenta]